MHYLYLFVLCRVLVLCRLVSNHFCSLCLFVLPYFIDLFVVYFSPLIHHRLSVCFVSVSHSITDSLLYISLMSHLVSNHFLLLCLFVVCFALSFPYKMSVQSTKQYAQSTIHIFTFLLSFFYHYYYPNYIQFLAQILSFLLFILYTFCCLFLCCLGFDIAWA
eukprot:158552_1